MGDEDGEISKVAARQNVRRHGAMRKDNNGNMRRVEREGDIW